MAPYLKMGVSNVFYVKEQKVRKFPYLEMVGSNDFLFRN